MSLCSCKTGSVLESVTAAALIDPSLPSKLEPVLQESFLLFTFKKNRSCVCARVCVQCVYVVECVCV